jgi:ribosomal-protein-alanine N-acetyltransferase
MIATTRLRLRPVASSDSGELLSLFRDAGVRRYLLDDALVTPAWVNDEIVASDERFAKGGAGLWSIQLASGGSIIGFVGFREFFDPPQLQLLYGLLPAFWGRGVATEAALTICEYAFRELGFLEIAAATDVPNEASIAVLRRLGMRAVRTANDCGPAGTAFFAVNRHDWSARF